MNLLKVCTANLMAKAKCRDIVFTVLGVSASSFALACDFPPNMPEVEGYSHVRTNTAHTLTKGETELSLTIANLTTDSVDRIFRVAELEYGLTPNILLAIEVPTGRISAADRPSLSGLGNIEFEAKYRYLNSGLRSYAVAVGLELPTGNSDTRIGSNAWAVEIAWLVSFQFAYYSAHAELGVEWEESEGLDTAFMNAAVDIRSARPEMFYQVAANVAVGEGRTAIEIVPGIRWRAMPELLDEFGVGIGIPIGITHDADDWGVIVNFEFEF